MEWIKCHGLVNFEMGVFPRKVFHRMHSFFVGFFDIAYRVSEASCLGGAAAGPWSVY
jgi:hypothetical protein